MNPAACEIGCRRPVWAALSNLFLDNELESPDLNHIAAVVAASPYTVEEVEDILFDEVYPVLVVNLKSVIGEWAGFDLVWLEEQILLRERSIFKLPRWMQTHQWMIRGNWGVVKQLVRDRGA